MSTNLRVLFLAAEADPWIKIGGLGDVAGSLPAALRRLSAGGGGAAPAVDVRLAIPFHGAIQRQGLPLRSAARFRLPYAGGTTPVEVLSLEHEGLPVYFIGGPLLPADAPVYASEASADGLKFTFFSLAALELARQLDWAPHVLHANDWHTAPAIYALGLGGRPDAFFRRTATVLGLHNLPYLGAGATQALAAFGLPPARSDRLPAWARDAPLALGLLSADQIVAVSPTYASEILTDEFGAGLDAFLRKRAGSISGILNGLDTARWNPAADEYLAARFDPQNLAARQANKRALQAEFGLPQAPRQPLLAVVSRLDRQKGVDLAPEALRLLASSPAYTGRPWQIIVLGTGDASLEADIRMLETDFPGRARAVLRFDAALSRRIYAGADILLIPSRYEPCGISQMIAMRYGCVPLGRATGGLRDTIQDYGQSGQSTGFLFTEASAEALALALGRAFSVYNDPTAWRGLQLRGMQQDFSWERSALQYLELYSLLVHNRGSKRGRK
ncbi:MAG: glycogen synthase [Anaerolineales bacterium]|nr:glycogen synthase [Anaerolineales bacterium]